MKKDEEKEMLRLKYKKDLRKALARRDDETILRIMEKTKMTVEELLQRTEKPEKVSVDKLEIFLKSNEASGLPQGEQKEEEEEETEKVEEHKFVSSEQMGRQKDSLKLGAQDKSTKMIKDQSIDQNFSPRTSSLASTSKESKDAVKYEENIEENDYFEPDSTKKWGDVEIVSAVGPKWSKSRLAQSYEYLEFIRDMEEERFKILSPVKYQKYKKAEGGSEENTKKTTQLLLSGPGISEQVDLPEKTSIIPPLVDYNELCRHFCAATTKRSKADRKKSRLPRSRLE